MRAIHRIVGRPSSYSLTARTHWTNLDDWEQFPNETSRPLSDRRTLTLTCLGRDSEGSLRLRVQTLKAPRCVFVTTNPLDVARALSLSPHGIELAPLLRRFPDQSSAQRAVSLLEFEHLSSLHVA